jgi:hypothetical protein
VNHTLLADSDSNLSLEFYIMPDGQSANLSWNKAPIWGLRPDFYYCQTVACLLMWGALSDERTGLSFTIVPGSRQLRPFLGSNSRGTHDHNLLSQIRDFLFRRLLRLAELRWRYSTPPPHGRLTPTELRWISYSLARIAHRKHSSFIVACVSDGIPTWSLPS